MKKGFKVLFKILLWFFIGPLAYLVFLILSGRIAIPSVGGLPDYLIKRLPYASIKILIAAAISLTIGLGIEIFLKKIKDKRKDF